MFLVVIEKTWRGWIIYIFLDLSHLTGNNLKKKSPYRILIVYGYFSVSKKKNKIQQIEFHVLGDSTVPHMRWEGSFHLPSACVHIARVESLILHCTWQIVKYDAVVFCAFISCLRSSFSGKICELLNFFSFGRLFHPKWRWCKWIIFGENETQIWRLIIT